MKSVSTRLQIELIALAYLSLLVYAAYEWYVRYLAELNNPIDAQGGMWAFGDEILAYYLFFLFLFPTLFLLRLLSRSERAYTGYARLVFAVALTATVSAVVLASNVFSMSSALNHAAAFRLFRSPMIFIVIVMSRIFARSKLTRRLLNGALVTEVLTLFGCVAGLLVMARQHT